VASDQEIHFQVQKLLNKYIFALDNYERIHEARDIFTSKPPVVFSLLGEVTTGYDEVIKKVTETSNFMQTLKWRHHLTSWTVRSISEDRKRVEVEAYYIIAFRREEKPLDWGYWQDVIVLDEDGKWKFAERHIKN